MLWEVTWPVIIFNIEFSMSQDAVGSHLEAGAVQGVAAAVALLRGLEQVQHALRRGRLPALLGRPEAAACIIYQPLERTTHILAVKVESLDSSNTAKAHIRVEELKFLLALFCTPEAAACIVSDSFEPPLEPRKNNKQARNPDSVWDTLLGGELKARD